MIQTVLRYLLMFAVLLTSNSQALMAAQSFLSGSLLTEAVNQIEQIGNDLPPCHQVSDNTQLQVDVAEIQLECERDCNCCGGSCSSFAMTLDLPLALSGLQHFEAQLFSRFSPQSRLESLQRPPIFA